MIISSALPAVGSPIFNLGRAAALPYQIGGLAITRVGFMLWPDRIKLPVKFWNQIGVALVLFCGAWRSWALPSFEPFSNATSAGGTTYANGAALYHQTNALAEGWAQWNGGTITSWVMCTNTGLNYAGFPLGFPAPSLTNAVYLPGTADHAGGVAGQSAALVFSKPVSADPAGLVTNVIYASFLLKVPNLGNLTSGSPIYFGGFATNRGDQSVALPVSAMKIFLAGNSATAGQSGNYTIGVANNSGSGSADYDLGGHLSGDVLLVVVAYEFGIQGGADVARLWVNPPAASFNATPPPPVASTNILAAANKISQAADFFLLDRTGSTLWGGLLVSDLRVGTNWSYVTGGSAVGTVLSLSARAGNWILSGSNGWPGATNHLLSATNIALPLSGWAVVATNVFDGNGRFTVTNPASANGRQQFYALQVPLEPDPLWIPECGAWLGAEVTNSSAQAFSDHEAKIGRELDILRIYHTPGSWTALTSEELSYINAGRKLLVSFKPNSQWSNAVGVANGGSATVDSQLASLAKSVAGVKPNKLMICVWHEPENDVGKSGTTNDYVAMWHNVRTIFEANGATNVIWAWIIENYAPLRYLLPGLWPGNTNVDWVGWDAYQGSAGQDYVAAQMLCYNYMLSNTTATVNYASKPWAWAEWGVGINGWAPSVADQTNTFNAVTAALNGNLFPRVRYVSYFDDNDAPNATSAILPGAWGAYSNLANSPYLMQKCGQ